MNKKPRKLQIHKHPKLNYSVYVGDIQLLPLSELTEADERVVLLKPLCGVENLILEVVDKGIINNKMMVSLKTELGSLWVTVDKVANIPSRVRKPKKLKYRIHFNQINQMHYTIEAFSESEAIAEATRQWKRDNKEPNLIEVDIVL